MEWKKLSQLVERKICYGIVQPGKGKNGNIPVIKVNNIISGLKSITELDTTTHEIASKFQRTQLFGGEIVVSVVGSVGNTAIVPSSFKGCNLVRATAMVDIKDKVLATYVMYYFKTHEAQKYIESRLNTTVQATLNIKDLEEMPIPILQSSIILRLVSILSALDAKIENNNKINANLEAQAQALFKSWFVDFTPFKDQPFVDSELGPIPQGWKVGTLGDIANIIMGQSPAGSSYNERGNGVIFYQGRTEFGFRFPNVRLYTTMPKRYAEPMSILLSVRAPVGDINVAIEKCCIGRGLASISSKRGLHSFLLYLVKSLKNRLEVFNGEGTVFGSINKNTLTQFKIIIPPIEMQEKFNEIIQRHDCMVLELHKEIINLSTQRDTLLPKLMSGEIKL